MGTSNIVAKVALLGAKMALPRLVPDCTLVTIKMGGMTGQDRRGSRAAVVLG
jgi:hypothetical protein